MTAGSSTAFFSSARRAFSFSSWRAHRFAAERDRVSVGSNVSKSARRRSSTSRSTSGDSGIVLRWLCEQTAASKSPVAMPGGELAHRVALRRAVRGQHPGRRIQPQVVAGELLDHVAGHGEQGGAVDAAGAAGLLGGDDHRCGLAGPDAVGHQHTAVGRGEDAPHDVLLVRAGVKSAARPGRVRWEPSQCSARYRLNSRL